MRCRSFKAYCFSGKELKKQLHVVVKLTKGNSMRTKFYAQFDSSKHIAFSKTRIRYKSEVAFEHNIKSNIILLCIYYIKTLPFL